MWCRTYGSGPLRKETCCHQFMVYFFPINSKRSCIISQTIHTMVFVTQVVDHWLEKEISKQVHQVGSTHCTMSRQSTTDLCPADNPCGKQTGHWASQGQYIYVQEGNVLFNDTLNTFYLLLYGVGHMVKDHSDSERGNPPATTWATLSD